MTTEVRILRQLLESLCNSIYRGDSHDHLLYAADDAASDVLHLTGTALRVVPAGEPAPVLIGSRPDFGVVQSLTQDVEF